MIQKEKLSQFYFSQYRDCAKALKKKNNEGKKTYVERLDRLLAELKRSREGKVSQAHLEEFHRQLRNLAYFAFRENNQIAIMKIRDLIVGELARLDVASLKPEEQELVTAKLLEFLRAEQTFDICQKSLRSILGQYVNVELRGQIIDLVPTRPETEFPKALEMSRRFILHIGPTNCGKTYQALERMKEAENGVYLGPLRLLALEVYEKMKDAGIPCTMLTGEERIYEENSRIISSTVEMLDLDQRYDVAVIDEAQMIADSDRGHSWTRAILGVQAAEVHVCLSPSAEEVVTHLIALCGDSFEVHRYERKTRLLCEDVPFSFPDDVQEGDALIVFTKRMVLDIAGRLERSGIQVSVIYGSLPPEIRRRQIQIFAEGKTRIVVSTDAIGMGLNLPVRRIVFVQTTKFDGKQTRPLKTSEIRQIAGRAGRYGIYHKGYVGATQNLELIRAGLEAVIPPLEYAVAGFSDLVLQVEFDLLEVLTQWNALPTVEPYRRLDISRYIAIISKLRELGFTLTKEQELRAANIPFDETDDALRELFFALLRRWQQGERVEQPGQPEDTPTLPELELYYRKLDLYFSFSKAFGCPVDEDRLYNSRERVAEEINEILLHRLRTNIRFCTRCGKALPLHHRGRLCDVCFQKERRPGRNPRR